MIVSGISFKINQIGITWQTLNLNWNYIESGSYSMQVRGDYSAIKVIKFFMWSFIIDTTLIQSNYMEDIITSTCIVTGCSSCFPAIVDTIGIGCLSEEKNEFKNSN